MGALPARFRLARRTRQDDFFKRMMPGTNDPLGSHPAAETHLAKADTSRQCSMTASAAQVRSPIHRSSIGSWRPHRNSLGPLIEGLGISFPGGDAVAPLGAGKAGDVSASKS